MYVKCTFHDTTPLGTDLFAILQMRTTGLSLNQKLVPELVSNTAGIYTHFYLF